jgi:hypothetical protein
MTGNGKPNVYFYTNKEPANKKQGVQYVNVGPSGSMHLTNGNSGYLVRLPNTPRIWKNKKYLYPLNIKDLQKNPNLKQNPGW